MSLDHLWAGWRSAYVASVVDPVVPPSGSDTGEPACVFCDLFASQASDDQRYVVHEDSLAVVVLNAFPYASGHMLVMPRRHVGELGDLDAAESAAVWETARVAVAVLGAAYAPDGVNLGANLGRAAGAGIPRHVHLHVLPRWIGDTNFMTAVAATRVLPEALSDSWAKLRAAWPR
ncbi:MAG TPA: HIT domain-containing protein [Acidimicrobiales bacterium]|nr:HIT domain-containing protein [Acidimicrobiales bacterium]